MPKPKSKKKKKVSYETRSRRLKEHRASLSDEQRQKIKEYNRARSLKARANETPVARELRLQKSRESARLRRCKRKAQVQKEMRKLGIIPPAKQQNPNPLDPNHPLYLNVAAQMKNPGNNNLPSNVKKFNDLKFLGSNPGKNNNNQLKQNKTPLPFINYKPAFPAHMTMPQTSMREDFDDMATVCPIECNVDITPDPVPKQPSYKFKQPTNPKSDGNDEIVKNIGAHVVIKKKVVNKAPPEDARLHSPGGPSDWNGTASVCPIECNVDITDLSEPLQQTTSTKNSVSVTKRNSLLDSLKQMGTHVIIKKKGDDKNASLKSISNNVDVTKILPVECNVDIRPIESRLKNSELTIVKHNGSNIVKRPGSQITLQKVAKPVAVQQKDYESPEEAYDDYDMPCPIECNVDISESS